MDNPGVKTLGVIDFSGASGQPLTLMDDLSGMTAISLEFAFQYGTGGTSGNGKVQTTFDGGTTWRDIARVDFATSAFVKHCNLEGLLSKGITAYADLASEGVYDGVLGDALRFVPTWTGNYSNTTFAVRASVR